ncbi:MAG: DNA mismatch repair protein MutS [Actinomycetota bacterium]|nr:DNA mismatch repair protein MutS [Actinomycetota bacterium]
MKYFVNFLKSSWELFLIIIIIVSIILTIKFSFFFLLIPALAITTALLFLRINRRNKIIKIKSDIQHKWGRKRLKIRDLDNIEKLYAEGLFEDFLEISEKENKDSKGDDFKIDNTTWNDLDMDLVFEEADHTMTIPGQQFLYNLLRNPVYSKEILNKRSNILNWFYNNKNLTHSVQYFLYLLGAEEGMEFLTFLKENYKSNKKRLFLYWALVFILIPEIILIFFFPLAGIVALIISLIINSIIFSTNKLALTIELPMFKYIIRLINCGKNILNLKIDNNNLNIIELNESIKKLKKISRKLNQINLNGGIKSELEVFLDFFNLIFLREPILFYETIETIKEYEAELRKLYSIIGEIDSYIAISSYRSSLSYYVTPKLEDNGSEIKIEVKEIYHPLIGNPVTNSIFIKNMGTIITGSNASGKSTFLKTIGINAIFAQTFNIVLAKDYSSSYFKIFTSIGRVDNIIEGDSYFMVEAKSLKRIIDSLNSKIPILCILDEIFRGTNTAERISAGTEVLNYLIENNCITIVATHDLELTKLVESKYKNYHFSSEINGNDIVFDYKLHKGPCTNRNAINILKFLGYPSRIHEKASEMASNYMNKSEKAHLIFLKNNE